MAWYLVRHTKEGLYAFMCVELGQGEGSLILGERNKIGEMLS